MNNLAVLLNEMGVWHESIPLLKEVLRVGQIIQFNATESAVTVSNLGFALYMSGDLESADRLIAEQAGIYAKSLGDDNPATDRLLGLAVRIWCERNRLEEAVTRGREVVARRRKIYAPGHPLTGNALLDLGRALALQDKYGEAEQMESEALTIYKKSSSQSEYYPGWAEHWRGVALLGLSRWSDAESMLISAEQKLRTTPMTPPRHYREVLRNLAKLYEKWNKPAEAEKWRAALAKYPEVASLPRAVK